MFGLDQISLKNHLCQASVVFCQIFSFVFRLQFQIKQRNHNTDTINAWVYLGYLWKRAKNPFLILTHQRILVSWISACWPPHQRNVQQVDRLAVGHRQTPNRSPMETGQNLSSQKIGLKVKKYGDSDLVRLSLLTV